ncbi:MAG TPA: 4a-hydroxytetrahydrobiopterin dehydratase [Casimicrobiaceae bacterium]|jgi:4a-hydroxytetrahydrobiopterin dehydratase
MKRASNLGDKATLAAQHCRAGAPRLSTAELKPLLAALPDWKHADKRLMRTYRFPDFYRTIAFVNALAWMANVEDHHPDLSVHYGRVVVAWSTHDAGGVTLNDCICAAKTDQLAP